VTSQIPPRLIQFADEYEQAARRELRPRQRRSRRRTFKLATASSVALGSIAAAVVLVVSATSGASPAYALTHNSDGSITISLSNLTTGISGLNARLQQMGINYTVIPVTPNCSFTTPVLGVAPGSLSETITIGTKNTLPAGADGFLAAEQLPNGYIALGAGSMRAPLPTCFSPTPLTTMPSSTGASKSGRANTRAGSSATTTSSAPLPLPPSVKRQLKAASQRANSTQTATTTTTSQ
jgi:hypothetical protein